MPSDPAYGERAETYLRLLAEAALRPGRDDGPHRVHRATHLLVEAGVLTDSRAAWILLDLAIALRARGLPGPSAARRGRTFASARRRDTPPGEWRVIPGPDPVPGAHIMALILAPDRVLAPAALPLGAADPQTTPWAGLSAADDAGTDYLTTVAQGSWTAGTWTGTLLLRPAPPPSATWIKIFIPNGFSLHIPLQPPPPPPRAIPESPETAAGTPGERLLTRYAESFLAASARGILANNPRGFASVEPSLDELTGTLEAAGALPPLSPVPRQIAELHTLLGLPSEADPPAPAKTEPAKTTPPETALSETAPSEAAPLKTAPPEATPSKTTPPQAAPSQAAPSETASSETASSRAAPLLHLPHRWLDVAAYYGRRRQARPVPGTAAIAVRLPDIDSVRFAVAGLHSGPDGTQLLVLSRGLRPLPRHVPPGVEGDTGFSWWLRDDAAGWHLGSIEETIPAAEETLLRIALLPPLTYKPATLTAEITSPTSRVTAPLPLHW